MLGFLPCTCPLCVKIKILVSIITVVQGILLNFKDAELEAAFRRDWAKVSYRADCGLYLLALSLWCLVWHTLQGAGESRRAKWAAGNAVMCCCTLVFMRSVFCLACCGT